MRRVRNVGNWANGSTLLGLGVAAIGKARVRRGPHGLWFAEGYQRSFPVAGAFTIGSVILTGSTIDELEQAQPGTLEHEENHTWQWTYSLGLPFLGLYTAAMGWSWLKTGDRASRNVFERLADLQLGGYQEAPSRSTRDGVSELRTWARNFSRAGAGGKPNGPAGDVPEADADA